MILLVVYTSRGLNIERVPFDKERWSYVLAILHRTYFRHFLPAAARKKVWLTSTITYRFHFSWHLPQPLSPYLELCDVVPAHF